jgi:plasmid stabilization system protein ParE
MQYQIIWSPKAKLTYNQILDYLETAWTEKEIKNFIERTEEALNHILSNPFLYPHSRRKKRIHRCVIARQVSLFYRITDTHIELLVFWDNRRDPVKLEL